MNILLYHHKMRSRLWHSMCLMKFTSLKTLFRVKYRIKILFRQECILTKNAVMLLQDASTKFSDDSLMITPIGTGSGSFSLKSTEIVFPSITSTLSDSLSVSSSE